jgi:hypothetical protein
MIRVIESQDIKIGNKFICVYDDDDSEESWAMNEVKISRISADDITFTMLDRYGAYKDEATLTLTLAQGLEPYCHNYVDNHDYKLCLVPCECISEEDHFLCTLQGDYTNLVNQLLAEGKIPWMYQ